MISETCTGKPSSLDRLLISARLSGTPIDHYKLLDAFDRDGAFEWTEQHGIPFAWVDGKRPVEDTRQELKTDPVVMDWLEL